MPIPTPPADASGGYVVLQYTNGAQVHRMRLHVLAFNNDATGSYVVPPVGGEASVQATAANVLAILKQFFTASWTLSMFAVFQRQGANIVEVFGPQPPAAQVGTHAAAGGALPEEFEAFNMRTTAGGRFRVFILQEEGWAYSAPLSVTANAAGTARQQLVAEFTQATSAIVGHDNNKPVAPARTTYGTNKRIRRRVGDA